MGIGVVAPASQSPNLEHYSRGRDTRVWTDDTSTGEATTCDVALCAASSGHSAINGDYEAFAAGRSI